MEWLFKRLKKNLIKTFNRRLKDMSDEDIAAKIDVALLSRLDLTLEDIVGDEVRADNIRKLIEDWKIRTVEVNGHNFDIVKKSKKAFLHTRSKHKRAGIALYEDLLRNYVTSEEIDMDNSVYSLNTIDKLVSEIINLNTKE